MTRKRQHEAFAAGVALAAILSTGGGAKAAQLPTAAGQVELVEIHDGTATFKASTNLAAIKVHGKSKALEGRARIRQSADGLVIERLEAVLPVRTLNTGLGLRDEHMRKYVFTTADGKLPDVRFVAERATCSGTGGSYLCKVSGDLIIRDTPRRFTIDLKVTDDGKALRAAGDGVVRLSTYAISAPSQLGVTTSDDVSLHMNFVVKRVDEQVAQGSR